MMPPRWKLHGARDPNAGRRLPDYPDPRSAFLLTLLAIFATLFTSIAFLGVDRLVAMGIGQAIGIGAVATMAAKRVPDPQPERIGLRALELDAIPMILCLAPAVLLMSELDNYAADWSRGASGAAVETSALAVDGQDGDADGLGSSPLEREAEASLEKPDDVFDDASTPVDEQVWVEGRGFVHESALGEDAGRGRARGATTPGSTGSDASAVDGDADANGGEAAAGTRLFDPDDPWSLLQLLIVMVGIAPIVEEFFFRGVIQQGLIAVSGLHRGLLLTALLSTLARPVFVSDLARFLVAVVGFFALAWLLGIVRLATRSVLGPMLLASSWAAIGLASLALEGRLDLPGMNVDDSHLPILVTLVSAALVGWAGLAFYREALRRFEAARVARNDDDEPPPPIPLHPQR
ncbi:MAG: CPBP family intramembrane metalloprotease [Spirochaetaceae bacterium]|nr:CPBP family intramembrane metalloprotease [Myxococcales bacterium]MCB9723936.1 CPBP family intramembrane metalloprotease [Spirochaetaceae bacterium]